MYVCILKIKHIHAISILKITEGASEMQGKVKPKVCVADGSGGHGEDAEPKAQVRPNLSSISPSFFSSSTLLQLNHLTRVEKSSGQGVQQDRRVDYEGASSSPVVKEKCHAAREEKTSECVSCETPTVSQAPPCPSEPLVDLEHPRDRS